MSWAPYRAMIIPQLRLQKNCVKITFEIYKIIKQNLLFQGMMMRLDSNFLDSLAATGADQPFPGPLLLENIVERDRDRSPRDLRPCGLEVWEGWVRGEGGEEEDEREGEEKEEGKKVQGWRVKDLLIDGDNVGTGRARDRGTVEL